MGSGWRERLEEAIKASGKSLREISLAIGRSHGYLYTVLDENREPSASTMIAIADVLGISGSKLILDLEVSADSEALLRLFAGLEPAQQKDFIRLAEAAAGLAGGRKGE